MDRSMLTAADRDFIEAFEACAIAAADWNHPCHIRMAWIYLRLMPLEEALVTIRAGLRRFAMALGVPDEIDRGYHETMTAAWIRLVASAMKHHGPGVDSETFCREMPHLLCRTLLRVFYSRERIRTFEAKAAFVPPDLAGLPSD